MNTSDLNASQLAAVMYNDGPQLVIAGAGSGKTRVLTYKIAHLLEQGVPAGHILALTFTNKAAREMKGRIYQLVGEDCARYLWMGTFHSIFARLLRQEAELLGYTHDYSIYDTTDSRSVVKHIVKDMQLDDKVYKPNVVHARISVAKNNLQSPNMYAANREYLMRDRFEKMHEMSRIYAEYNRRLRAANAMDFDDILVNTHALLQKFPEVAEKYQEVFQYILVDEYQDTNRAQYMIIKRLAEKYQRICVVGDDAQSIYSFRGADIGNILNFQKDYPDAQLFKLEQNYRSTQTIVNAANSLIRHNKGQIRKEVFSDLHIGERISLSTYMTDRDEAKSVAKHIRALVSDGYSHDGVAVLYRTNAQSRVIEDELRQLGIPYRIYGGTSFYQRKEIKDVLGYLRLVSNRDDNEAFLRIINYPTRGIGDTTVGRLYDAAVQNKCSLMQVASAPERMTSDLSAATEKKVVEFAQMIDRFAEEMSTKDAFVFTQDLLMQTGILREAKSDTTPEGVARYENLEEMLSGIHEFCARRQEEGIDFTPIADFLAEVSLLTDQDEHLDDTQERVTLLTIHAAKGLEFRATFIVGMEEGLFPSAFCQSAHEIEEERRLLYVAITRSMERCYLMNAKQRFRNGQVMFTTPSRFLKDIDRQFVLNQDDVARRPSSVSSVSATKSSHSHLTPTTGAKEKSKKKAIRSEWAKDDRVMHRVFGAGTVLEIYRENDNDKIDILFDGVGKKTLLVTYAKLERL
ncbi:MAG: UvrD-helicase domain-containing protein [Paludibacteraceae bacterium]|nr:UvrD-helicase domain-containing protein [Paludibacteraceae bacterium]